MMTGAVGREQSCTWAIVREHLETHDKTMKWTQQQEEWAFGKKESEKKKTSKNFASQSTDRADSIFVTCCHSEPGRRSNTEAVILPEASCPPHMATSTLDIVAS